jgi:predicted PhzF superfamily epimerase YddE/YHI9
MRIPYYHVDAFTDRPFAGNPAGVCPLERWLDDATLQAIAAENNLSETAFFFPEGERYALRWFTPVLEIDLCGHATLASAHVLYAHLGETRDRLEFTTLSGSLFVSRDGERLVLDLPARPAAPCELVDGVVAGLGARPAELLQARDHLAIFATEAEVRALAPDFAAIASLESLGVIASAPGDNVDFVSRFFAPRAGVDEDPVTGSAHCTLVPYWSRRLGKATLHARQISARGGELFCEDRGERVAVGGQAVTYKEGSIHL